MKILDKVKGVFFEEIEYTETNMFPEDELNKTEVKERKTFFKDAFAKDKPEVEEIFEEEISVIEKDKMDDVVSERDLFKSDSTFNFPAFDDEEELFGDMEDTEEILKPIIQPEVEYTPPERITNYERLVEPRESKAFKPTPIISPVYGIISGDKPVVEPKKDEIKIVPKKKNDATFDSIREKAYGNLEHELETAIVADDKDIFYNLRGEESEVEEENILYDFVSTDEDLSNITLEEAQESYEYRGIPFDNDKFKEDTQEEDMPEEEITFETLIEIEEEDDV